jgi:hypothetical protein
MENTHLSMHEKSNLSRLLVNYWQYPNSVASRLQTDINMDNTLFVGSMKHWIMYDKKGPNLRHIPKEVEYIKLLWVSSHINSMKYKVEVWKNQYLYLSPTNITGKTVIYDRKTKRFFIDTILNIPGFTQ